MAPFPLSLWPTTIALKGEGWVGGAYFFQRYCIKHYASSLVIGCAGVHMQLKQHDSEYPCMSVSTLIVALSLQFITRLFDINKQTHIYIYIYIYICTDSSNRQAVGVAHREPKFQRSANFSWAKYEIQVLRSLSGRSACAVARWRRGATWPSAFNYLISLSK